MAKLIIFSLGPAPLLPLRPLAFHVAIHVVWIEPLCREDLLDKIENTPPHRYRQIRIPLGSREGAAAGKTKGFSTHQQEGIMTIWNQWIHRGVLCGLVLGGLVGCAMVASPPIGEIAENDHAALANWYDKEAAHLRQHAKDEMAMAGAYRKNPDPGTLGVVSHKIDMIQHCEALAGLYTKAAEQADQAAKTHRDMLKK